MMHFKDSFRPVSADDSIEEFQSHLRSLGINLPCDPTILSQLDSPLACPCQNTPINGKTIGNRFAIQPMEGADATPSGGITQDTLRRWRRFGLSGAKTIFGGEAMAVLPEARSNPNQLLINNDNLKGLGRLRESLIEAHDARSGQINDLLIGFQLIHAGRFSSRTCGGRLGPRIAYRHPILDRQASINSDESIVQDSEISAIVDAFIRAAQVAADAGADFVDINHSNGYLLHEFLSAYTRPGPYGGPFENRTRLLREIIQGIRASGNPIEIAVRLSAFDSLPFVPNDTDPINSPGVPEEIQNLPYRFAFGVNPKNPLEHDLTEATLFVELCGRLGIKLLNITAGSTFYNPHIARPSASPSLGEYPNPQDCLVETARQIFATRHLRMVAPKGMILIGSGYSSLQHFLPQIAQAAVRSKWVDIIGLGRVALSYPEILSDALRTGAIAQAPICYTCSACSVSLQNGIQTGCYPLDPHYQKKSFAETVLGGTRKNRRLSAPRLVDEETPLVPTAYV
jgi:NADPH2 dehydrogenase